jgi:uncharacterized membrane protein YdcZ (DUF606 family)
MDHITREQAIAPFIALMVGLSLAALLDWLSRRQKNAIVEKIAERVFECLIGGVIEATIVGALVAGMSEAAH